MIACITQQIIQEAISCLSECEFKDHVAKGWPTKCGESSDDKIKYVERKVKLEILQTTKL